jgi:hypothetical protein
VRQSHINLLESRRSHEVCLSFVYASYNGTEAYIFLEFRYFPTLLRADVEAADLEADLYTM